MSDYQHPFPKFRKLRVHYQPNGAWQLIHAECGSRSVHGILTHRDIQYVNCKRCLAKVQSHVPSDDRQENQAEDSLVQLAPSLTVGNTRRTRVLNSRL